MERRALVLVARTWGEPNFLPGLFVIRGITAVDYAWMSVLVEQQRSWCHPNVTVVELTDDVGPESPGIQDPKCLVLVDLGIEISNAGQIQEMQGILHDDFQNPRRQPSITIITAIASAAGAKQGTIGPSLGT